jgi:hypothetical protein
VLLLVPDVLTELPHRVVNRRLHHVIPHRLASQWSACLVANTMLKNNESGQQSA